MTEPEFEVATDFPSISKKVERGVRYKFPHHPHQDDVVQECIIQAWRLYMKHEKSEGYIVKYGIKYALHFVGDNPRAFLGSSETGAGVNSPGRRTSLTDEADLRREKIVQYRNEYFQLHGKFPSGSEIGRATGIPERRVRKLLKSVLDGTAPPSRVYDGPVKITYIEDISGVSQDTGKTYGDDFSGATLEESYEEWLVSHLTLRQALLELPEWWRTVVYHHYWQDMSLTAIAKMYEVGPPAIHKVHKKAIVALQEYFNVVINDKVYGW